jgi:hypothetical protein
VQGVGIPGPQDCGTGTLRVIGNRFGSDPVNVADPLYGGSALNRKLGASINV